MPKTLKELYLERYKLGFPNSGILYYNQFELNKELEEKTRIWRNLAWEYSTQVHKLLDKLRGDD